MRKTTDRIGLILGIIFLIVGLVLSTLTVINYKNYFTRKQNYIPIDAVVVGFDKTEHIGDDENPSYYMYTPIVEFEVDGSRYQVHSSTYARYPAEELGDIVKIRYNKNNPKDVIFEKDSSLVIGTICSLAFTLAGLIVTIVEIKRIRKAKDIIY